MTSNSKVTSVTKPRESNMELFRCVAMFMIVAFHANFWSLTSPETIETQQAPVQTFTRFFLEAVCVGAVTMFVLISGWFGIRPKLKGFVKLMFQIFFCITVVYLCFVATGLQPFSIKTLAKTFALGDSYWFVKAYIGLYILAPVLNAFVEKATRRQFEFFLLAYYAFEFIYGWVVDFSAQFEGGYSMDHFIFIYMLARYVRVYHTEAIKKPSHNIYLLVFVVIALFTGGLSWITCYFGLPKWGWGHLYYYNCPTTIAMSLALLLYFSRLKIQSKFINWVAASSFSVYLLHCLEGFEVDKFQETVQHLYASYSGISCLLAIFVFLITFYSAAILFDQLRRACWFLINKIAERKASATKP